MPQPASRAPHHTPCAVPQGALRVSKLHSAFYALHAAAQEGDDVALASQLAEGVDPDQQDYYLVSPCSPLPRLLEAALSSSPRGSPPSPLEAAEGVACC